MYKRRNFVGSFLLIILFLAGCAKEPLDIQTPGAGFRAKRKATVSISPAVVPYKRRVKVRISGSGFEPNKEVALITRMGGVLSDISYLVKPRPVTDESGGFSVVWTLNREIRRKIIKSTTILVMDRGANTIGTEPLVFEGKSRRRNEERRWINEFVEAVREGRVIRFIVGYAPGGGYDTYTRVVARHISKYIPGNPTMFVQNMTGGGSLIAANYTYNRAKPDGLTVGVWNSGIILQQVLGEKKVKFKADKFGWVGAPVKGWPTCAIMGHTGLKTLKDVVNSNQRIKVGATRAGSTTYDLPKILNKTLGTKFDVISGYTGTFTIRWAMQKQEVDAACWGWESMSVTARAMLDADGDDQLIPFLTQGDAGDPEIAHLPQITDVIKGEDNLATFRTWMATYEFQRPLSLPPGTPKDRLNILRRAFKATVKDRRFLASAKRSKLIINYVSGEQIERYVDQILMAPPKAKKNLRFLVRRKN